MLFISSFWWPYVMSENASSIPKEIMLGVKYLLIESLVPLFLGTMLQYVCVLGNFLQ